MPEIHAQRRIRLAEVLAERDLEAALITRPVNVRYLTRLASSNAALLVRAGGEAVLATDSRYAGTAEKVCPDVELVVVRPVATTLAKRVASGRLGFEAHEVTVEAHQTLAGAAPELVPLGRAVEELRMVKDEAEIDLLRRACEITSAAFDGILPRIAPGVTEREIAVVLERSLVDLGGDASAFEPIVAGGPNSAIPHHPPSDRRVERGDLLKMDFGALYGGYHADMTRTVAVGEPAAWQRELYEIVALAQRTACERMMPEMSCVDADALARDIIVDAGFGEEFEHGLGHGVGLEIHEAPSLGRDKPGKLADRVTVTAEPGIYLAGRGGVRIEDTLVVRADGPEILTKATKELLVL